MPLPASGQISFEQIRAEFGGTGEVSLSQYYRNGGRVSNDAFCHNNTVPANGEISFGNFIATTNGNNYYTYTAAANLTPPANTIRAQVWALGGGGGGAGSRLVATRPGFAAAGGGGGGLGFGQINIIQTNGEYLSIEVGGGGAGATSGNTSQPGQAGSGGSSLARRRNSAGTILENSPTGGGGGGGRAKATSPGLGGDGGAGGSGNAGNGGAGVSAGWGASSRSAAGGASAVPSWGGAGGGGSSSPSGAAGTRGFVQIRI